MQKPSKLQFDYETYNADSVGTPARVEIEKIYWDGHDVTEFVQEECPELIPKWEEHIHRKLKNETN